MKKGRTLSMDMVEKARIRLDHWISHNDHHYEDYAAFSDELEKAGKTESALAVREMMSLTEKSTECLKRAKKALDE